MKDISNNKSSDTKKLELKDFEQFDRKAEKQNKQRLNRQSESYLDYGLEEEEELKKYERYFK